MWKKSICTLSEFASITRVREFNFFVINVRRDDQKVEVVQMHHVKIIPHFFEIDWNGWIVFWSKRHDPEIVPTRIIVKNIQGTFWNCQFTFGISNGYNNKLIELTKKKVLFTRDQKYYCRVTVFSFSSFEKLSLV